MTEDKTWVLRQWWFWAGIALLGAGGFAAGYAIADAQESNQSASTVTIR